VAIQTAKKAFTELAVKALPIGKHFDPSTPALGMRAGKNRRTWIVQRGVDRRIIRVGHYPAMTLAEVRTKGKQLLAATLLNHERVTFPRGLRAVYKAARYASGVTAGYWKHQDGKWVAPKAWLPDGMLFNSDEPENGSTEPPFGGSSF
jgi:hypothetical protein